jgi:hypothetical protein
MENQKNFKKTNNEKNIPLPYTLSLDGRGTKSLP